MSIPQQVDNTARRRASDSAQRAGLLPHQRAASYSYLKNMLDNIADPIFVKDASHRWIDGNKAFWSLMGGPPENFLGKTDHDFFPKEEADHFWKMDDEVFRNRMPTITEEFLTDHQGKRHVLSTTKTVFENDDGELVLVGTIRDITAQKELEELEDQRMKAEFYRQLEQKVRELQESNYELNRFAWVASHDLQEPLRTIIIYLELLQHRYAEKLDDRAREYIDTVVDSTGRLQKLVDDLLVHARVEKVADFVDVDLEHVLGTVRWDLQAALIENNADMHIGRLPTVKGDPVLLAQVLQNLITNALKFKATEARPRIDVDCAKSEGYWLCTVKDNGIGIEPEYLQTIFGFFTRLHPQSVYPGSGIGLATCKKIIELHGGRIWAESHPGQGSIFYFALPA